MKKPMFFRVISVLIIAILVISGMAIAEGVQTADVEFAATETDDNMVKLTLTVKNATFMGLQTALSYDADVLVPATPSGETAEDFGDFAKRTEKSACFNTVGLALDKEKGMFGFTYYILPGTDGENVNESGEYVADETGVELCSFYFKKIADEEYRFAVISGKDTDFVAAVDPGIYIMDYANGELAANISFTYDDKEPEQTVVTPALKPETPVEPEFTDEDRKKDVILLQIGRNLSVAYGEKRKIDPENDLVVPYIVNDRTLVPLRFIAETLGAEVLWEEGWDGCIIKKDDTEIKITFGSADFTVNGEKFTYEAPIEVVHDRTMVPVRFVSENLGCDVYWHEKNKAVVISPADNPWVEDREAEKVALGEMLVTILPIMQ